MLRKGKHDFFGVGVNPSDSAFRLQCFVAYQFVCHSRVINHNNELQEFRNRCLCSSRSGADVYLRIVSKMISN